MRRLVRFIEVFSVASLALAFFTSSVFRRSETMSDVELARAFGADHLKMAILSRNCDQVNKDLVNDYGAGTGVRSGQGFIAGSSCSDSTLNKKCLSCAGTANNGPSPSSQSVISTNNWGVDSFNNTNDYSCGAMTLGNCLTLNGFNECVDSGDGSQLGCAVIQYWIAQTDPPIN